MASSRAGAMDIVGDDDEFLGDGVEGSEGESGSDGDEAPGNSSAVGSAKGSGSSASKGKPKAKSKGSSASAKSASRKSKVEACFCCEEPKKGKSRFCEKHKRLTDAISYQAKQKSKKEECERILGDPVTCARACDQFERDNPPGRFQKKLIDWSQWRRDYVTKVQHVARRGETAWRFSDFTDEKRKCGWTVERINQYWQGLLEDPRYEKEGEGDDLEIWLPDQRKRFRDKTKEINNVYSEGSKAMKKLKLSEANQLKDFNHAAMPSHADAFFKDDAEMSGGAGMAKPAAMDEDEEEAPEASKKNKGATVDLSTAVPDQYELMAGMLKRTQETMKGAIDKAKEVLDMAKSEADKFSVAQAMLHKTVRARMSCGVVFLALSDSDCADAKIELQELSARGLTPSTPIAPSSRGAGVGGGVSTPPRVADPAADARAAAAAPTADAASPSAVDAAALGIVASPSMPESAPATAPALSAEALPAPDLGNQKEPEEKVNVSKSPMTKYLQRAVYIDGRARLPVQTPELLYNYYDLQALIDKTPDIDTVDKLNGMKETWKKVHGMAGQLREGISKSATKLKQSLDTIKRQASRAQTKEAKAKENEEINKVKSAAAKAAEQVKKDADKPRNIFAISAAELTRIGVMPVPKFEPAAEGMQGAPADLSRPLVVEQAPCVMEWKDMPKYQVAAGAFGGHYKMSSAAKRDGKCQMPLKAGEGKEETDNLMKQLMKKIGAEALQMPDHLEVATGSTWLEGFVPKQNFAGLIPQGLPILKVLTSGELSCLMCSLGGLTSALGVTDTEKPPLPEALGNAIMELKADDIEKITKKGCLWYSVELKAFNALFVPAGWVLAQRSGPSVLIYGARKSFCMGGATARASYKAVVDLHKNGKPGQLKRYEDVLAVMNGGEAAAAAEV